METTTRAEKLYMSVDEVAARLGVSRVHVWTLCDERKLGHLRCGKRVLIAPAHLEKYLAENTVEPLGPAPAA